MTKKDIQDNLDFITLNACCTHHFREQMLAFTDQVIGDENRRKKFKRLNMHPILYIHGVN